MPKKLSYEYTANLLTERQYDDYQDSQKLPTTYEQSYYDNVSNKVREKTVYDYETKNPYNDVRLLRNIQESRINLIKDLISLIDPNDDQLWMLDTDTDIDKQDIILKHKDNEYIIDGLANTMTKFMQTSSWNEAAIQAIAEWYLSEDGFSGKYDQTKYKFNPLIGMKSRADCSGFVCSCLIFCGVIKNGKLYNSKFFSESDNGLIQQLRRFGFVDVPFDQNFRLQGGDIVWTNDTAKQTSHIYIAAREYGKSWDFGNTRTTLPIRNPYMNMVTNPTKYKVWRYNGVFSYNTNLPLLYGGKNFGTDSRFVGKGGGYDELNEIITRLGFDSYRVFLNKTARRESSGNKYAQTDDPVHYSACGWFGITNSTRQAYTSVSREHFLQLGDLQVTVAVKHYNYLLELSKKQKTYYRAKQNHFTDEDIVSAYWLCPRDAQEFFNSGNLVVSDKKNNLTVVDAIRKYREG